MLHVFVIICKICNYPGGPHVAAVTWPCTYLLIWYHLFVQHSIAIIHSSIMMLRIRNQKLLAVRKCQSVWSGGISIVSYVMYTVVHL